MQGASIPKGTRDFTPVEMNRRNYIFDTIRDVYKLYGFAPIETPAMEKLSTLMGKYGEEGDKLLFRILDSGNFLKGLDKDQILNTEPSVLSSKICGKGLRYDLTVPFARFVVQHQNELTFPFKRYQVQPVWRADRPQKGRYREFYQCDADVIGSKSLLNEVELIQIIDKVFTRFNIPVTIKLNNRKILTGIAELVGQVDKITDITVAIDKLDKIGIEKVKEELVSKGLPLEAIEKIEPVIGLEGSNEEKLEKLSGLFQGAGAGHEGVNELQYVLYILGKDSIDNKLEIDISLARGLNYYTGAIIEVKANNVNIGSICGGGRYDDLTGIFGLPGMSGVGISFGADRVYDVMLQQQLFPPDMETHVKVMFVNFGEKEMIHCLGIVKELREAGISSEIYPDAVKMKKQMSYANNKSIPYVVLVGEEEMKSGMVTVKDMEAGKQEKINTQDLVKMVSN